jgi:8-oxo-dGTP pyrophosphatase MutT (NUDIX family)
MDPDEFPRETLRRELAEEIGFTIEPGRLLSVDFTLARPERPRPSIMYVYDCGILDARQQEQIVLPADELSEHRFVAPDALAGLLRGRLCRRILEALRQRELGGTADQENGHVPGTARLVPPEVAESLD